MSIDHVEYAVRVNQVTKKYKLYNNKTDRLKEAVFGWGKSYHKDFYAVNDVSFDIKKGETLGIIGKNGSGKSTLLKMITGVLNPSEGSIEVNGRISALLELGAGFNPEYTGIENVYLNGTIMGLSREEIDKKIDEIIEFADIGDFIHQPVKMYSSGMFVRLAFAVAVNVDPEILIIDEALSVGDTAFQAKCFAKFRTYQESGKTILFVTHDIDSVLKYCTRGIVIQEGSIIYDGAPKESVDLYKKILVNIPIVTNLEHNDLITAKKSHYSTQLYSKDFSISPVSEIYGNNKANIIDFGIFDKENHPTQKLVFGDKYIFKMIVQFNEKIDNPIFTYTIRDLVGKDITGTNTMNQNIYTGQFVKDEKVMITFEHEINLNSGNYLLTFACSGFESDQFVVFERLYHILLLEVVSFKKIVGYFDLNSKITVERNR